MLILLSVATAHAADTCDLGAQLERALSAPRGCGTTALLAARDAARYRSAGSQPEHDQTVACVDAVLERHGLRLVPDAAPVIGARADGDKLVRDARTQPFPNEYDTVNFAIKWGSNTGFDHADVEAMGDAFEVAWAAEIDGMGYTAPNGTELYKFNVYIGDTGGGTPGSEGAAGYYYTDADGMPMIVMAAGYVSDHDWTSTTAAHEFFHALQDRAATYTYDGQGAWYWEAGAMWIEGEVYPEKPGYSVFLFGFAYLPELPLNDFLYPDGSTRGYHQYGAFLYLRHLTENVTGNADIIKRSWEEAPRGGDPLLELDDLLAEQGTSLDATFTEFIARNATFDYTDEDVYEQWIAYDGGFTSPYSHRPSGTVIGAHGAWNTPALAPSTYGANYWRLQGLPDTVTLTFEGDEGPSWDVWVVHQSGGEHTRQAVALDDGDGSVELTDLGSETDAWLVVGARDGTVDHGAQYDYRFELDEADPPDVDPGDTDVLLTPIACGCSGGGPTGAAAGLGAAFLMVGRQRSSRRRHTSSGTGTRRSV